MFPKFELIALPYGVSASRSLKVSSAQIIFLPVALNPRACFIFSINVFLHEPFFVDSLNWAVLEENWSIKTILKAFLCHFKRNVNHLAWPRRRPPPILVGSLAFGPCGTAERRVQAVNLRLMPIPENNLNQKLQFTWQPMCQLPRYSHQRP